MTKVFNTGVGAEFKVVNMGGGTFGTAYLADSTAPFPGFSYGSWGDTHDFICYGSDRRQIATWDDNGGPTDKMLLLYIKTTTADLRIFRNYLVYTPITPALIAYTYEVYYNGNTTTYTPSTGSEISATYNLGAESDLTLILTPGAWWESPTGYFFSSTRISWSSIPNLQKIGGGIGAVLNTISLNTIPGSGVPAAWNGGHGSNVNGYNNIIGLTKSDLINAANSSPGNQSWDKTSFDWNPNSSLFNLARHSPAAVTTSRLEFECTINATTDTVTLTKFNGKDISLYKGTQFKANGAPICFSSVNAGGLTTINTYFIKDVSDGPPINFKLTPNLAVGESAIDITSNGSGIFEVRNCSRIDCDWCDNNETLIDNVSSVEGNGFDLIVCDLPPNWPSPTTSVGGQGVELFNVMP